MEVVIMCKLWTILVGITTAATSFIILNSSQSVLSYVLMTPTCRSQHFRCNNLISTKPSSFHMPFMLDDKILFDISGVLQHQQRRRQNSNYIFESLLLKSSINDETVQFDDYSTLQVSEHDNDDDADDDERAKFMKQLVLKYMMEHPYSSNNNNSEIQQQNNDDDAYGPIEQIAYQLLRSIRHIHTTSLPMANNSSLSVPTAVLGMKGYPFIIRRSELERVMSQGDEMPTTSSSFSNFFTMNDLQQALQDDFLDAARGSTDPRTGWKITDVSVPRGDSFEEARMTYNDVCDALEKGTVIFNAAGAHIPKLANICLAACDATSLPCALNMYITSYGKRTSAPPHTDKQDVCVFQMEGCKLWKVFAIPDPSFKPNSDIFARGKSDDNLPLHILKEQSKLLLETILYPGDVLFIPAGFPHTTSTTATDMVADVDVIHHDNDDETKKTSLHLTMGIDHHIWELNYLSVIRLAYRRMGRVYNNPIWDNINDENSNPFVGKINLLPIHILHDIMAELPLGLLDADGTSIVDSIVDKTANIIAVVDPDSGIAKKILRETVERIRQQGIELLDIHCDMYMAAIQEGRTREAEKAMTAHLDVTVKTKTAMSPDRIQRLSLFRVKKYYDLINNSIDRLKTWSFTDARFAKNVELPMASTVMNDIAVSHEIAVGDKVEADLGGAFFPATVTKVSENGSYDVTFFDGDKEVGLSKSQIRLLSIPKQQVPINDTSKMTAKQLKRWKKEQDVM